MKLSPACPECGKVVIDTMEMRLLHVVMEHPEVKGYLRKRGLKF